MVLAAFAHLLQQTMGLDAASIGMSAIEHAVQERLSACKLKDAHAYWEHTCASETELQALIEAVVVPETWFFRDRETFAALVRVVQEERLQTHPEGVLRLLSVPCSTGEEPYTMAMALLDAGVPAHCFRIDAVDISTHLLTHARCAVYGKNAFRGNALGFRDRHFEPTPCGYHLANAVRQQVHFQQGNVFSTDFLPGTALYDVIFCRNMLIYFDDATQARAINVLTRLLKAQGWLCVGPSETGVLLRHDFISAKVPMAFALRKVSAMPPAPKPITADPVKRLAGWGQITPPTPALVPMRAHLVRPTAVLQPLPSTAPPATLQVGLDEAIRCADQGHLAEAATLCKEHVRKHGPSAAAYHLMGLMCDATGNQSEADNYYRKALYLDPHHHEALIHLAVLLERQGNMAGAQVLRNRERRLGTSRET